MILHYLNIAIRNLSNNKVFSLINILGLAVGMGACLLIYQYVHFELSYDKFHPNVSNIHRLTQTSIRNGEVLGSDAYTTYALGPRGKEHIPEIVEFVRIHPNYGSSVVMNPENNEPLKETEILFVDRNFLQIFNFTLKTGHQESALDGKHNIVITEKMAVKYFGNNNPVGKVLKVNGGWTNGDFIVSGVLKTPPVNSHLQFDFLMPMKIILEDQQYQEDDGWAWGNFVTYVVVTDAVNLEKLGEKFDQIITSYHGETLALTNTIWKTGFQSIAGIHLRSDVQEDPARNNGSIQNVRFFSIVAIFILIVAWGNYINLSTALAIRRKKEVGIRKSIGALRKQLINQFLLESLLINLVAAALSIGIALLALPVLSNLIGIELEPSFLKNLEFWTWFSTAIIFGSILSGLYPAFFLSSFKAVKLFSSGGSTLKRGISFRRGLIVFQFLTCVLLISGTYLVNQQITFMKGQDLGMELDEILVLNGPMVGLKDEFKKSRIQTFKNKLSSHHSISMVSSSESVPGKEYNWRTDMRKMGKPEETGKTIEIMYIDFDFLDTYDLQILTGRPFSETTLTSKKNVSVVINEEALKVFDLGSPENALQEKLVIGDDTVGILAVIKNFHWNSLREAHSPYLFAPATKSSSYFSIKINLFNIQESISHIETIYKSVFPDNPFNYYFLDDEFNQQYQSDLQFRNLFSAFSILAIFIASLGLFALVSFSATLRIKELGIRKVFGATVGNLMILLSREYIILLLLANVMAVPVIILGGRAWLNNYAFKTGLGVELFFIPALVLIIISLVTVSYRTYSTARMNLAESLRTE